MRLTFRPLAWTDLDRLVRWQSSPHVRPWWPDPSDPASIRAAYGPVLAGEDPTEVFIVEVDGQPVGMIQRYRHDQDPAWDRAVGVPGAVGIDYYIGEAARLGQGIGTAILAGFSSLSLADDPEAEAIVAVPQQANRASCRSLEKAGFERVWSGVLESGDPSDAGPAHVYARRRSRPDGPGPSPAPSAP